MSRTARFQPPLTHLIRLLATGEVPTDYDIGKAYSMVDVLQDGWYAAQDIGFTSLLTGSVADSSVTLLPPSNDATYIIFGVSVSHLSGAGTPSFRISRGVPVDLANGVPVPNPATFLEVQMGNGTLTAAAGNTAPWSTISGGAPYWVLPPGQVLSFFTTSDLSVAPDSIECRGDAFAVPSGFKAI